MAHSLVDRASSFSADPLCKGLRPNGSKQTRRNSTAAASARQFIGSFMGSVNEHAASWAPSSQATEAVFSVYNSAKSSVSGSVQNFIRGVASKIPSYPDLTAFLPNAPFRPHHEAHTERAGDQTAQAKQEKEEYMKTLSQALSQPLLMPFIERADRPEVLYATLLADLSNMAYEANKVGAEVLAERHQLVFISSSSQPMLGPITRDVHWDLVKAAHAAGMTSEQMLAHKTAQASALKAAPATDALAHKKHHVHGQELQNAHSESSAGMLVSSTSRGPRGQQGSYSSDAEWTDDNEDVFTRGPLSPDIEYSILLGSMEEMLPDDSEYQSQLQASSAILGAAQHAAVQQLLGSMEDEEEARSVLDSIEEEISRAAARSMTLNHFSFVNGVDSMASIDDFWPGDESTTMAVPKQPTAPRLPERRGVSSPAIRIPTSGETTPRRNRGSSAGHSSPHAHEDLEQMPGSPQSGQLLTQPEPPAAWFVADDPQTHVRYVVIQGSTSFDHWSINFKFDPVIFESPALGVRVHRGVYEAALRMYDDLVPLVKQHLATAGPDATVSLSGHSLGGSLASVLMMLLVYRKVAKPKQLSPSYTFGAPAVFCPLSCTSRAAPCDTEKGECDANCRPVMDILGIPDDMLVNVMMHKDIVPRAFVCDYTMVADLLKQWMPSFKDHSSLSSAHNHKMLYNFIGRVAVLRPDNSAHFVSNDNFHPMLPDEPGMYKLREPPRPSHIAHLSGSYDGLESMDVMYNHDDDRDLHAVGNDHPEAVTLQAALLQFMNYPHPLQTLSMYESYGPNGAISRFHNPDNYTKGLLGLPEHQERKEEATGWNPLNFDDLLEAAASVTTAEVRRF